MKSRPSRRRRRGRRRAVLHLSPRDGIHLCLQLLLTIRELALSGDLVGTGGVGVGVGAAGLVALQHHAAATEAARALVKDALASGELPSRVSSLLRAPLQRGSNRLLRLQLELRAAAYALARSMLEGPRPPPTRVSFVLRHLRPSRVRRGLALHLRAAPSEWQGSAGKEGAAVSEQLGMLLSALLTSAGDVLNAAAIGGLPSDDGSGQYRPAAKRWRRQWRRRRRLRRRRCVRRRQRRQSMVEGIVTWMVYCAGDVRAATFYGWLHSSPIHTRIHSRLISTSLIPLDTTTFPHYANGSGVSSPGSRYQQPTTPGSAASCKTGGGGGGVTFSPNTAEKGRQRGGSTMPLRGHGVQRVWFMLPRDGLWMLSAPRGASNLISSVLRGGGTSITHEVLAKGSQPIGATVVVEEEVEIATLRRLDATYLPHSLRTKPFARLIVHSSLVVILCPLLPAHLSEPLVHSVRLTAVFIFASTFSWVHNGYRGIGSGECGTDTSCVAARLAAIGAATLIILCAAAAISGLSSTVHVW